MRELCRTVRLPPGGAPHPPLPTHGESVPWKCDSGRGYCQLLIIFFYTLAGVAQDPTALPAAAARRHSNGETRSHRSARVVLKADGGALAPVAAHEVVAAMTRNASMNAGREESRHGHVIAGSHVIAGENTSAGHIPHILGTAGELPVSHGLCGQKDSDWLCQETGKNVGEARLRQENWI